MICIICRELDLSNGNSQRGDCHAIVLFYLVARLVGMISILISPEKSNYNFYRVFKNCISYRDIFIFPATFIIIQNKISVNPRSRLVKIRQLIPLFYQVQRGLSVPELQLPGAPDPLPLHAQGLQLQILR